MLKLSRRSLITSASASAAAALAAPALLGTARASAGATIRMMASPYGSQSFIPFVMESFGLPEKHGFTLERITFSDGGAARSALQGGAAEIAVLDWLDVARMRQHGVDIRSIAPFTTYVSVFAAPTGSAISTIPDLAGKRFGAFARNGVDWYMFKALAQRDFGFDIDSQMEVTEGAPTLLRGLLEQGSLDAALLFSSITPPMIASGAFRSLFTASDIAAALGLPRAPYLTLNIRGEFADANPEAVRGFVAAWQEVYDILMAEDQPWVTRGAEMSMEGLALEIYRDQMRADMLRSYSDETPEVLTRAYDILIETAGAEAIGLETLPEGIITTAFQ